MIIISIVAGALMGRLDAVATQALTASKEAVTTIIAIVGVMCFWNGLLKIAEKSGLIRTLSRILKPLIHLLFPKVPSDSAAAGAIISNMSANMLGMGNAATPFGIKAMHELDALNKHSADASDAMCMFVVVNTASIQLIPTTMIAILSGSGAANPFDIILPTLATSFSALVLGTLMCAALAGVRNRKRQRADV